MPPGNLLFRYARAMIVGDQSGEQDHGESKQHNQEPKTSRFNDKLSAEDPGNHRNAGSRIVTSSPQEASRSKNTSGHAAPPNEDGVSGGRAQHSKRHESQDHTE